VARKSLPSAAASKVSVSPGALKMVPLSPTRPQRKKQGPPQNPSSSDTTTLPSASQVTRSPLERTIPVSVHGGTLPGRCTDFVSARSAWRSVVGRRSITFW